MSRWWKYSEIRKNISMQNLPSESEIHAIMKFDEMTQTIFFMFAC